MPYNKVTKYADSENILESEVGLVTKTGLAKQSDASTGDGRTVIKAGALFDDSEDEYTAVANPTADSYEAVTPAGTENPSEEGWYEKSGSTYTASTDTSVSDQKTYYALVPGDNPKTEGWYEKSGSTYTASTDTSVDESKTYYEKTYPASNLFGVVLHDYDMTDYEEKPIAVVVAGRLKTDKVSSAAVSAKSDLAAQGLYLV
ncbi:MAG: hypothetical protein IJH04_06420 [Eggerthellaceae bacterium]|nr:hypothetical protein [Eggerthellaceae bacterium]